MRPPLLRPAAAGLLLVALAACNGSADGGEALPPPLPETTSASPTVSVSPEPVITVPGTATPSPAATVTTTPAPTPTSAASRVTPSVSTEPPEDPLASQPPLETAPPTGQPTCDAKHLTVTDADAIVDKTSVRELFVVRTTGPDCELLGYPTVELRDARGRVVPATYHPGGFGLTAERPTVHTLSKGTSISFQVAGARTGASCLDAATLRVTLPRTSAPLTTTTGFSVCDRSVGLSPIRRELDAE